MKTVKDPDTKDETGMDGNTSPLFENMMQAWKTCCCMTRSSQVSLAAEHCMDEVLSQLTAIVSPSSVSAPPSPRPMSVSQMWCSDDIRAVVKADLSATLLDLVNSQVDQEATSEEAKKVSSSSSSTTSAESLVSEVAQKLVSDIIDMAAKDIECFMQFLHHSDVEKQAEIVTDGTSDNDELMSSAAFKTCNKVQHWLRGFYSLRRLYYNNQREEISTAGAVREDLTQKCPSEALLQRGASFGDGALVDGDVQDVPDTVLVESCSQDTCSQTPVAHSQPATDYPGAGQEDVRQDKRTQRSFNLLRRLFSRLNLVWRRVCCVCPEEPENHAATTSTTVSQSKGKKRSFLSRMKTRLCKPSQNKIFPEGY